VSRPTQPVLRPARRREGREDPSAAGVARLLSAAPADAKYAVRFRRLGGGRVKRADHVEPGIERGAEPGGVCDAVNRTVGRVERLGRDQRSRLANLRLTSRNSPRGLCHGNSIEHALRAKPHYASCRCDGFLPLCSSFGSEDPQCGSGDEVALKVEGVVNRAVHADELLSGSS
jgi:hypothetical protein